MRIWFGFCCRFSRTSWRETRTGPRLAQLPNQPREAPTSFLRPHQEKKKGTWQKPS